MDHLPSVSCRDYSGCPVDFPPVTAAPFVTETKAQADAANCALTGCRPPVLPHPERLQLAMQRRALHADELRCSRDVAGEAADLGDQIVALEHLAGFA